MYIYIYIHIWQPPRAPHQSANIPSSQVVCCSVAVCSRVLRCVAECCRVLQAAAPECNYTLVTGVLWGGYD